VTGDLLVPALGFLLYVLICPGTLVAAWWTNRRRDRRYTWQVERLERNKRLIRDLDRAEAWALRGRGTVEINKALISVN
jgi:hypothetical protein